MHIIRGIYTLYYEGKESGYNDTIYNFNNNRVTVGIIHGTHRQCWGCNRNYTMQRHHCMYSIIDFHYTKNLQEEKIKKWEPTWFPILFLFASNTCSLME